MSSGAPSRLIGTFLLARRTVLPWSNAGGADDNVLTMKSSAGQGEFGSYNTLIIKRLRRQLDNVVSSLLINTQPIVVS